jgi:hypothetical protein
MDFQLDTRLKLLTYKFKKLYDKDSKIQFNSWVQAI